MSYSALPTGGSNAAAGSASFVAEPIQQGNNPRAAQQPVSSPYPLGYASYVEEDGSGIVQGNPSAFDGEKFLDEADQVIRQGFVRKVFGILGIQLAVTSAIIAFFSMYEPVTKYVDARSPQGHPWVFITAMLISFACVIGLSCFPDQARIYPNNYAILGVFTLAESVLLGVVCTVYSMQSILIAGAITSLITFGLMVFAFTTKRDFTGAGPYLFMALWCLLLYGLLLSFVPVLRASVHTAYSFIGVVLFSFFIVYDVQLIIGGKHSRYRFGIDEHVFAALNIYLDIINLFIRILHMFGRER